MHDSRIDEVPKPVKVFYAYAREDESFRDELEKHLSTLSRQGYIEPWHDRRIVPGQDWEDEIDKNLEEAGIILLLVSSDFIASDYCYKKEMRRALERHKAKEAWVIPIIVRPCDWQAAIGKIQASPTDGKPVSKWEDQDEAWTDVAIGIRTAIGVLSSRSSEARSGNDSLGRLKEYLVDDRYRIAFDELVSGEVELAFEQLSGGAFPLEGEISDTLVERLAKYEELMMPLLELYAFGCHWGEKRHVRTWIQGIERLAEPCDHPRQRTAWVELSMYPALLMIFAGGVASVAGDKFSSFASLLTSVKLEMDIGERVEAVIAVDPIQILNKFKLRRADFGSEAAPLSSRMHSVLREPLGVVFRQDRKYDEAFDRFEYLFALVKYDLAQRKYGYNWGPLGQYALKNPLFGHPPIIKMIEEEVAAAGDEWGPLQAGLFDGSLARFKDVKKQFDALMLKMIQSAMMVGPYVE